MLIWIMWVAKYKIKHENCLLTPLAVKHKVTDFVHLLNHWEDPEHIYYTEMHT